VRERLIDSLIQGNHGAWAAIGVLWLTTTLLVLLRRGSAAPSLLRLAPLLLATTTTSLAGLSLASALAVPRLRWKSVDGADLLGTRADTWRRLRGPVVPIGTLEVPDGKQAAATPSGPGKPTFGGPHPNPSPGRGSDRSRNGTFAPAAPVDDTRASLRADAPDVAVPTIDARERWVLFGLLSGRPVEGLPEAVPGPIDPSANRICPTEADGCRPWPAAWPDAARPPAQSDLHWARASALGGPVEDALAYDVETGLYLRPITMGGAAGARAGAGHENRLELIGRLTADPPREGTSVLFVLRSLADGRLRGARVVATPAPSGGGHVFHLQRADVSLIAAPRVLRWFARPALSITSFALPMGLLVALLAPLVARLRGRGGPPSVARAPAGVIVGAVATFAAGVAVAAPAVVAMASLWASR
jgi:hypothetical protein